MNQKQAPFFNYRKRQRQAILSDPSEMAASDVSKGMHDTASSNLHANEEVNSVKRQVPNPPNSSKFIARSGLMDIKGNFNQGQKQPPASKSTSYTSGFSKNVKGDSGHNISGKGGSFSSNNISGRGGSLNSNTFSGRGGSFSSNNISARGGSFNNNNISPRGRSFNNNNISPKGGSFNNNYISPRGGSFDNDNISGRGGSFSGHRISGRGGSFSSTRGRGGSSSTFGRGQSEMITSPAQFKGNYVMNEKQSAETFQLKNTSGKNTGSFRRHQNNSNFQQLLHKNTQSNGHLRYGEMSQNINASMFSDDMQEQSPKLKINVPQTKPKEIDTSMRILTCSINTARKWSQLKAAKGQLMFEIFGIVDSAVLKTKNGTGKEFMLSDDSSSRIKCIFHEIDRDLPKLTRGPVYRLICSVNCHKDAMQVISIRPAENEERHICHKATQVSEQEMNNMIHNSSEQ